VATFQANTGFLWTAEVGGTHNTGLGVKASTSPEVTDLS
jgi:hypothetical protein